MAFDNGVGQTNLRKDEVIDCPIQFPPLPEQQKIAEILSTVDDKINVIDQQINETQELKKGLMQRLLTKGIGHTEFKDSPLGEIPKSWKVELGGNIASKITKGASPKWQGFDYQNQGVLFVTSENVRDGKLDISSPKFLPQAFNSKQPNSVLVNGDVLINIVGASIGRACLFDNYIGTANINQAVCVFRLNEKIVSKFVLFYLQEKSVIKRLLGTQAGSARQNLSLSDIRNFKFLVPPLSEQHKISSILSSVDEKLEVLNDKKIHYQELKKGLMQQLLTGKIRVAM